MKTLSILLAIFINPSITWLMFFIPPVGNVMNWEWEWTISLEIKVVMEILVVIIAALTFLNNTQSGMLLAELFQIISSAGGIVWGIHLFDGWLIFCSSCLLTQGVMALWGLAVDHEHIVEWREIRK